MTAPWSGSRAARISAPSSPALGPPGRAARWRAGTVSGSARGFYISANRALGRPKPVWRALRGIKEEDLALRLLVAGISVCADDVLGADRDGEKNFHDTALWIGRNLGHRGETALRVGVWGIDMLLSLPLFELAADDVLVIPLTDRLDAFLDDVIGRSFK